MPSNICLISIYIGNEYLVNLWCIGVASLSTTQAPRLPEWKSGTSDRGGRTDESTNGRMRTNFPHSSSRLKRVVCCPTNVPTKGGHFALGLPHVCMQPLGQAISPVRRRPCSASHAQSLLSPFRGHLQPAYLTEEAEDARGVLLALADKV